MMMVMRSRATRLGEFSPMGRLFTLGKGLKIKEVVHNFGATFSTVFLTKSGLGNILGDFFTNSSGHQDAWCKASTQKAEKGKETVMKRVAQHWDRNEGDQMGL
jgi:hypothetical protein